jgi:hypothetical protein
MKAKVTLDVEEMAVQNVQQKFMDRLNDADRTIQEFSDIREKCKRMVEELNGSKALLDSKDVELSAARDDVLKLHDELRKKQAMIRVLRIEQQTKKDAKVSASEVSKLEEFVERDLENENALETKIATFEHRINEDSKLIRSLEEKLRESGVVIRNLETLLSSVKFEGSATRLQCSWWKKLYARSTRGEIADAYAIVKFAQKGILNKLPGKPPENNDARVFTDRSTQVEAEPNGILKFERSTQVADAEWNFEIDLTTPMPACSDAKHVVSNQFHSRADNNGESYGFVSIQECARREDIAKVEDMRAMFHVEEDTGGDQHSNVPSLDDDEVSISLDGNSLEPNKPTFKLFETDFNNVGVTINSPSFPKTDFTDRSTMTSPFEIENTDEDHGKVVQNLRNEVTTLQSLLIKRQNIDSKDSVYDHEIQQLLRTNEDNGRVIQILRHDVTNLQALIERKNEEIDPLNHKCKTLQLKVQKLLITTQMLRCRLEEHEDETDTDSGLPGFNVISAVAPKKREKEKGSNPTPRKIRLKERETKQDSIRHASLAFNEHKVDRVESPMYKLERKRTFKKANAIPPSESEARRRELGFGLLADLPASQIKQTSRGPSPSSLLSILAPPPNKLPPSDLIQQPNQREAKAADTVRGEAALQHDECETFPSLYQQQREAQQLRAFDDFQKEDDCSTELHSPLISWGDLSDPQERIISYVAPGHSMQGTLIENAFKNDTNTSKLKIDKSKVLKYVEKSNGGPFYKQTLRQFPSLGFIASGKK